MKKIQYNATTLKSFRNTFAKYHAAKHTLADTINRKSASMKSYQSILADDADDLAKLDAGETVLRTRDVIEASRKNATDNIERLKDELAKAREKCATACETAEALVTADLYNAYVNSIDTERESEDVYVTALVEWFKAQGAVDADAENVACYANLIGTRKNGAKASAKAGTLSAARTRKDFTEMFCRTLADALQAADIIKPHKYTFDVTKKQ
jgi:hypothetical protein